MWSARSRSHAPVPLVSSAKRIRSSLSRSAASACRRSVISIEAPIIASVPPKRTRVIEADIQNGVPSFRFTITSRLRITPSFLRVSMISSRSEAFTKKSFAFQPTDSIREKPNVLS